MLLAQPQGDPVQIKAWWEEAAKKCQSLNADGSMGAVIYTFWNIWKERNM
jgi:hypothetical protein